MEPKTRSFGICGGVTEEQKRFQGGEICFRIRFEPCSFGKSL
ncbi:hypothetical protein [Fumia xinanensis]|nr:hypothetical protein [Fumia xinanensis]